MTSSVVVSCPQCQLRLKVASPSSPTVVQCPECHTRIQLPGNSEDSIRDKPDLANDFGDLPEPTAVTEPVKKPKGSRRNRLWAASSAKSSSTNKRNKKKAGLGLLSFVFLFALGAVGVAAYWMRENLPIEQLSPIIPGHDSAKQMTADFGNVVVAMVRAMTSIEDPASRDKALPRFRRMTESAQKFAKRAVELGHLNDIELASLEPTLNELPEESKKVNEAIDLLLDKKILLNTKLTETLFKMKASLDESAIAIPMGLKEVPLPSSSDQSFGYEVTVVRDRVWRAVVRVEDAAGFAELVEVYDEAAIKLELILKRGSEKASATGPMIPPYAWRNASVSRSLALRWPDLTAEFGEPKVSTPFERYRIAEKESLGFVHAPPEAIEVETTE